MKKEFLWLIGLKQETKLKMKGNSNSKYPEILRWQQNVSFLNWNGLRACSRNEIKNKKDWCNEK